MWQLTNAQPFEFAAIWIVLGIAILGLLYALFLRGQVVKQDKGTPRMQEVWGAIRVGADAYLRKQLRTIAPVVVILTIVLFFSVYLIPPTQQALERFKGYDSGSIQLIVGFGRAIAFVMGSLFSLLVGQLGMRMAVQGNVRVASASRRSFGEALKTAYRSGTITGMLTDGLGLFGGTILFIYFGLASPDVLLGFGLGGTLIALFMRVGGGIFTKAADIGADLVGKVEHGVPEDDPRNAAVVADLVGDNVGDCAGMAADIFQSYEVTIVSGLILGVSLVTITGDIKWIIFPLIVRGIGVFSSIVGTYIVGSGNRQKNAMNAINRGFYSSAVLCVAAFFLVSLFYMHEFRSFLSVASGIILAIVLDELTKYFTDTRYKPVKSIAASAKQSSATMILRGLSVGFETAVWQIGVICLAIMAAVFIYWGQPIQYVLYGIAMTGIGMLTLTGNNVAMDSFGPISDNANGIAEMSGNDVDPDGRQRLADLDSVGNTTKAITKGVAIGSAVIAAVSLFGSFLTSVSAVQISQGVTEIKSMIETGIRIDIPQIFVGLLLGGAIPWLFSGLLIDAVARAAGLIVEEVRRQFHLPGLMEGKIQPDYRQAVGICTAAAQRELISLALISILVPIAVGIALGVEALGGFQVGVILSGQMLAVFMATSGGAWDNAKKTIEDGYYGGKGSEPHKNSVVGDTVGDPLKDTAGPALNSMIKVINIVSLLAAPFLALSELRSSGRMGIGSITTLVLSVVVVAGSILFSKWGGFAAEKRRAVEPTRD